MSGAGIHAASAPKAVGSYPHARRVAGLLFLSGIGPRDPATNAIPGNETDVDGRLVRHDISAQTHAVFANVRAVLEASGARWEDLVDVTVYLTDMAGDFAGYNAIWAEYFPDPATAPCRTTLGITALPTPIAIELKCIASIRPDTPSREIEFSSTGSTQSESTCRHSTSARLRPATVRTKTRPSLTARSLPSTSRKPR